MASTTRKDSRLKRRMRIRRTLAGTAERPRFCVMISNRYIYGQFVDDNRGVTLASVTTKGGDAKAGVAVNVAKALGARAAVVAKEKGIQNIVFDRGGFQFHGRVKALADAMREGGLCF